MRALMPFCVGLVLAVVCAFGSSSAAAAQSDKRDAALDRALEELVKMPGGPPGVVATVQRGDEVKLHRAGVAEIGGTAPIRYRDHVRIASVAKAFSGYVALRLVSKGKLSLKDTVGELVEGTPPAWAGITLRQLLQHTSGIKSFIADPDFQQYLFGHLTERISPFFAISFVFDDPLLFTPGTAYGYSNTDNHLIGLMVEAATGRSYRRNLADQVSRPLRLTDTSLPDDPPMPSPFAHGYDVTPGDPPEDQTTIISPSSAWASGAIVSSPRDMTRFIRAWAAGEFLSRKARRAQLRFIPGDGEPPGPGENAVGLAIFRYRTGCGRVVFGHSGNTPGYTNWVGATKNGRRSVAVTATTQLTPTTGAPGVFDALREAERLAVCAALAPESGKRR